MQRLSSFVNRAGSRVVNALRGALLGACLAAAMLGGCTAASTPVKTHERPQASATYTEAVTMTDGKALPLRVWRQPNPQLIILGIHGFNDYSKAYAPLAEMATKALNAQVYAYDQRGFGTNPDAGQWPGDQTLIDDIRAVARGLKQQYPTVPLVVMGESMGGALVLRAASEPDGLTADALVLLAPAVWGMQIMPWYQRWSLELLNTLAPDMTFTGRGIQHLGIRPTDDPAVSRDLSEDPFFIKETRVASLFGISQLMDKALAHPIRFPIPTLVMYGLNDRIIPPAPTCAWLSRLSLSSEKIPSHVEFVVYPEGWHMLTRQTRAEEVKRDLRDWLQALLVSKTSSKIRHSDTLAMTEKQPSSVSPSLAPAQQAVCNRASGFR